LQIDGTVAIDAVSCACLNTLHDV